MKEKIRSLWTERSNPRSERLDEASTLEILSLMNHEDVDVPFAVTLVLESLAHFVDGASLRLKAGGRLFYVGAGTSGRLGILDASECPPTFGTEPELVQGIIAGGNPAVFKAVEGAEDKESEGAKALIRKKLSKKDCVVGLSASGRTPFVLGALKYAKKKKALTAFVTCNPESTMLKSCDFGLPLDVGPEILSGSTRLKCGTGQKMILNMISTAIMIRLGRVKGNRMIDLDPKNDKLWERAKGLVMEALAVTEKTAEDLLKKAGGRARQAIESKMGKFRSK